MMLETRGGDVIRSRQPPSKAIPKVSLFSRSRERMMMAKKERW